MKKGFTLVAAMVVSAALAGCATGVIQAAKEGDVAALKQQIDAGADLNESGMSARVNGSPLSQAAYYCHPEAVSYLLQKGADIELSGGFGSFSTRPLHWAAAGNCKEAARLLLDAGADINAKASYPWAGTPLGIAAENGNIALIEYLMARGADVDIAIAGLHLDHRPQKEAKALLEEQRQKAVVEAARKAAQRQAEEKRERIRKTLERADLAELLEIEPEAGLQIEALTQALIRAKNTQLPAFLVRSSVEERVNLLTQVELRLADAQAQVASLNAQAEDAVRQGQSAASFRKEAGKVQTYASILSAIRSLLLQS